MAYTAKDAVNTFLNYINKSQSDIKFIKNTCNRGILLNNGIEDVVIFIYPISHKSDDSKNFFDTRDSGAKERGIAWKYALSMGFKYFCIAVHEDVPRYLDYMFSLECNEAIVEKVSGTLEGKRNGPGTQVVIPNDFAPKGEIERIKTKNNFFIAAIRKERFFDYLRFFDNRPYMKKYDMDIISSISEDVVGGEDVGAYSLIDKPHQRIFFGAPGTGKSYQLNKEAKEYFGDKYERVTFHPNFMYGSFVGTYKPTMEGNGSDRKIVYDYVPGPFMRLYVRAIKSLRSDNPEPYLLIIEEINRANVASVFGDAFQLLDRSKDGDSEYPIQVSEDVKRYLSEHLGGNPDDYSSIKIPSNMYIWATMNSADQGVMPMDTAFRRRWDFKYLGINDAAEENESDFKKYRFNISKNGNETILWEDFRRALNKKLSLLNLPEDKLIGPYFISRNILEGPDLDTLTETIKNKVLMYLYEDAAKPIRPSLFAEGKFATYSSLCDHFDKNALTIFKGGLDIKRDALDESNNEELGDLEENTDMDNEA